MKIYNVIEWKWNDKTNRMEEVYSDGYEYNGPIDLLAEGDDLDATFNNLDTRDDYDNTDYPNMCQSDTDFQNNFCCYISENFNFITVNGLPTRLGVVTNPAANPDCPSEYLKMSFQVDDISNGAAGCCVPKNIESMEFIDGFGGDLSDILNVSPPFDSIDNPAAFDELANNYNLNEIIFGEACNFLALDSVKNMLASLTESYGVIIDACQGFGADIAFDCEYHYLFTQQGNAGMDDQYGACHAYNDNLANCESGIPCNSGFIAGNPTYCNTATAANGNYCDVTDQCGVCGGDGSACTDCGGTLNGYSVIDPCGTCINCEGLVDNPGESCTDHIDWQMRCTGCTDEFSCNAEERIYVDGGTDFGDTCISVNNEGVEEEKCIFSANGEPNYCPPGNITEEEDTVPGCCYGDGSMATEFCDCEWVIGFPETYCNCTGLQHDVCQGFIPPEDSCGGPRYIDADAQVYVDGVAAGFYSTPNHPTGLYNLSGAAGDSKYCDCVGTETVEKSCYDLGTPGEPELIVKMCAEDSCSMFNYLGVNWVDNLADAQDPGCIDPTACNYSEDYDFDCSGTGGCQKDVTYPWDDFANIRFNCDVSCCAYPMRYCKSLGGQYTTAPDGVDGAGEQYLCDILGPGPNSEKPSNLKEYCPSCSDEDYGIQAITVYNFETGQPIDDIGFGPGAYQMCGTLGRNVYTQYPYTGGHPSFGTTAQIPPEENIDFGLAISNTFSYTPGQDYYLLASAPISVTGAPADDIDPFLKDNCSYPVNSSEKCGIVRTWEGNLWTLSGCTDPAARNNQGQETQPLYWDLNFPEQMNGETPVKTCEYCPPPTPECTMGYEFIWNAYLGDTISSQAVVTDNAFGNDGDYFYLGDYKSDVLISPESDGVGYNSGYCFCKNDLVFLHELGLMIDPAGNHSHETDSGDNIEEGTYLKDHPLNLTRAVSGTSQQWNQFGRLTSLILNDGCVGGDVETCKNNGVQILGQLPSSISYATELINFDIAYNKLDGALPREIEDLYKLTNLNLSYNNISSIPRALGGSDGHGIINGLYRGICAFIERNGEDVSNTNSGVYRPTLQQDNLRLWGNKICPETDNYYNNTTAYPDCLSPKINDSLWVQMAQTTDPTSAIRQWEDWIFEHLGFIELPHYTGYNDSSVPGGPAQNIEVGDGTLACEINGCLDPRAQNYWLEASRDCDGAEYIPIEEGGNPAVWCCVYDDFLHFPWGNSLDGEMNGSYGGDMELYEMIQALHAPICGFQYNSLGDIDVTNNPLSQTPNQPDACEFDTFYYENGYLPHETINSCAFTFDSTDAVSSGFIDVWDGIWLRSWSGYQGFAEQEDCVSVAGQEIRGDARPLEFIQRVGQLISDTDSGEYSHWYGLAFPQSAINFSMDGIEYAEDYFPPYSNACSDCQNSCSPGIEEVNYWLTKGRLDIAQFIRDWMGAQLSPDEVPQCRPENYELWESAPVHVSMSYSKKFISEAEANFTMYPEDNSPGVLRRTGQWYCKDGGPSEACYENNDRCMEITPDNVYCTPCGNETSPDNMRVCIPMTADVAAEGWDKITKTKTISVNYFNNGNSNILKNTRIFTSSLSSSNNPYYYSVSNGVPNAATSETQFYVSFGHRKGSGSYVRTDSSGSGNIGASEAVYKQFASMLLTDDDIDKGFLISSGSDVRADGNDGNPDEYIYVMSFKRKRFEDRLQSGNWTLRLSGSHGNAGKTIDLTDNSQIITTPVISTIANRQGDVARRFDIISGSAGTPYSGYNGIEDRYGFFYPDAGIMVFGEKLANEMKSGSAGDGVRATGIGKFNLSAGGNHQLYPYTGSSEDGKNALRFINCLKNVDYKKAGSTISGSIKLYGEKEVSEVTYIVRLGAEDYNFTNNFSILSGSGRSMYSGDTGVMNGFPVSNTSRCFTGSAGQPSSLATGTETITTTTTTEGGDTFVWPGSGTTTMHGHPHTFITGIQMYDEHGEMVAVAQLSKPFKKASDRESVIKVKLTY